MPKVKKVRRDEKTERIHELTAKLEIQTVTVNELSTKIEEMMRGWQADSDALGVIRKQLSRRSDGARVLWHTLQALSVGFVNEKHHGFALIQAMLRTVEEMGEAAGWKVPGGGEPWDKTQFALVVADNKIPR